MSAHDVMAGLVLTQLVLCSPSAQLMLKAQRFPRMQERRGFLTTLYLLVYHPGCLEDAAADLQLESQCKMMNQKNDCIDLESFFCFFTCDGPDDRQTEACGLDPLLAVGQSHQSPSHPRDVQLLQVELSTLPPPQETSELPQKVRSVYICLRSLRNSFPPNSVCLL